MKTARIVSVILALALLLAGLHAQEQQTPPMPPGHPPMGQLHGGMQQPGQPGGPPPGMGQSPMMDPQQQQMRMFARFQQMMEDQKRWTEDNAKINEEMGKAIAEMNAATGQKKADAVAGVLTRMFEQQKAMREQMIGMHQELMMQMMRLLGSSHTGGGMMQQGAPTSGTMGMHPPMGGMGGMGRPGAMPPGHPPMGGMGGAPQPQR